MVKEKNNLFIFRRDLRLIDNKGLLQVSQLKNDIIPIFIFTPEQISSLNKYRSNNSILFMIECLEELEKEIKKRNGKLLFFYGNNSDVLHEIVKNYDLDVVIYNKDYTPYAKKRDSEIEDICRIHNINVASVCDYYLNTIGIIKTNEDKTYTKFTPYLNKANKLPVSKPVEKLDLVFKNINKKLNFQVTLEDIKSEFTNPNPYRIFMGGRENGLIKLKKSKYQKEYNSTRNDLFKETTQLSAYIKFGCVSIREVYYYFLKHLGKSNDLIKQLYWRDFYMEIINAYPYVLGNALKPHYDKIKWINNKEWIKKWKDGKTGFPVVDACMRQMNKEGYMPNRGRLIVSSFLIKILLTDWRIGEKYFAIRLTDYDPANNNGGWQWSAGSGADSQQYNRIFNPWIQSEKHDPYCVYIKTYVPELMDLEPKIIHNWNIYYKHHKNIKYPAPIVDYKEQKEIALKMYSNIYT